MKYSPEVLAKRMRQQRKQAHMTQAEFAERLGVTRQTISLYEKAIRTPDVEFIYNLSTETGISPAYYLGMTDSKEPQYVAAIDIGLKEDSINALREIYESRPELMLVLNDILADIDLCRFIELANAPIYRHILNFINMGV